VDRTTARTLLALVAVTLLMVAVSFEVVQGGPKIASAGTVLARRAEVSDRVVALTIDDGPEARYTPSVLDTLERHHVRATFFVVGEAAEAQPALLRREIAQGCEVAAHTWDHPHMAGLSADEARREVQRGASAIELITGRKPRYFRPPRGVVTTAAVDAAKSLGMRTVLWSACLEHSGLRTPEAEAKRVLDLVHPGDIILMHDGLGDRRGSVLALDALLDGLQERGYRVVTLSELFAEAR